MRHGRVYWITGLSGSGKTTIGNALYYALREERDNVLLLDGDILRMIGVGEGGYSMEERLERGRGYARLCKALADQGQWVIICTIAMFDEIRAWNREHIAGYVEVFLDVPLDVLRSRDKKGLYSKAGADTLVGVDGKTEFPRDPDIRINSDGSVPVRECVRRIMTLAVRREDDYDRDSAYWDAYYQVRQGQGRIPSQFALYVRETQMPAMVGRGTELLELGCGDGCDSLYFLGQGLRVTAIDASGYAIDILRREATSIPGAAFYCDDFVKCKAIYQRRYDYIYSRFAFDAINGRQQDELLGNIALALKPDGRFCIEVRSIHDDLYGRGEPAGQDAFVCDGHYLRFIDPKALREDLDRHGFSILSLEEARGFSKTAKEDPVLLRVIAEKPC